MDAMVPYCRPPIDTPRECKDRSPVSTCSNRRSGTGNLNLSALDIITAYPPYLKPGTFPCRSHDMSPVRRSCPLPSVPTLTPQAVPPSPLSGTRPSSTANPLPSSAQSNAPATSSSKATTSPAPCAPTPSPSSAASSPPSKKSSSNSSCASPHPKPAAPRPCRHPS